MSKLSCYILAVALIPLFGCRKPSVPLDPASKAVDLDIDPCISIEYSTYGSRTPGTGLILSVWRDGRVVYSENLKDGGPPFQCGLIQPDKIEALTSAIKVARWSVDPTDWKAHPVYAIARFDFTESQYDAIYRHRFDDWLRATPVVPIEELTKLIETKEFNRDSRWVDSDGKVISSREVLGRSMSILIPENGIPFVTTLKLRK